MTDINQEYVDETTAELAFYVEEAGSQLNEYVKGNTSEDNIQHIAQKAVDAYDELEDRIYDVTDQLRNQDVLEEFKDEIEDAGYSGVDAFIEGRTPVSASGKNPERQVLDSLTSSDYIDTDGAFETMGDYVDLKRDLEDHYDIDAPLPELGEVGEKAMEEMEKVEQIMDEENVSAEEAIDRIDLF